MHGCLFVVVIEFQQLYCVVLGQINVASANVKDEWTLLRKQTLMLEMQM